MMLKRLFILCIPLLFIIKTALAQDEFEQIFTGSDIERLDKADKWYRHYANNTDSAITLPWLRHMLSQARARHDELLVLSARFELAYYYVVILRIEDSWLTELYTVAKETKDDYAFYWIDMMSSIGVVEYMVRKEYSKGLQLQLLAYEKLRETGVTRPLKASVLHYELARAYYELGNYEKCIELMMPLTDYSEHAFIPMYTLDKVAMSYQTLQALNTIGVSYRNLEQPDSALVYFNKTLEAAWMAKDSAWIGIASVNIAKHYIKLGQYTRAKPYAEARYQYSKQKDSRLTAGDSCEALIILARIDAHNGHTGQAINKLTRAKEGLEQNDRTINWNRDYDMRKDLYFRLSDTYYQKGNAREGYRYYSIGRSYEDSLTQLRKASQQQKVHTEVEAEKQLNRLKEIEVEKRFSVMKRNLLMIVLILTAILLVVLYNRQTLKSRLEQQLFKDRQQLLFIDKSRTEERLNAYVDLLQEKNKLIETIGSELSKIKESPFSAENLKTIERMETLRKTTILTEKDWVNFKSLFEKAYPGFFARLKEKYPDITPAELRLFAVTRLKLSPRDQANLLGISSGTIYKTRYRFFKKINQETETEDADFEKLASEI